jgi:hypothetical protein
MLFGCWESCFVGVRCAASEVPNRISLSCNVMKVRCVGKGELHKVPGIDIGAPYFIYRSVATFIKSRFQS